MKFRFWPRSLMSQMMLAVAVALLLAQGIGALLVYRAQAERREAALEHPEVHAEREHDREGEDQERPALVVDGQVEARSEARREEGERDENHVCGHDLADEGVVASRH